jgi:hypothetical protein
MFLHVLHVVYRVLVLLLGKSDGEAGLYLL